MSEDTDVVVSHEDAQYIIERQRREIDQLRDLVQKQANRTAIEDLSWLEYRLKSCPWLDRKEIIAECRKCLELLEGGDG